MHRSRTYFLFLLVGLLVFIPLFTQTAQAAPADPLADGVFTIGMEVNYAPFNWSQSTDKNGAVPVSNSPGEYATGYDVWLAQKLCDKLGVKLEIVKTEWDGLPPALESGKIDGILAGMSPTAERRKTIDFTDYYYKSDLVMVVRKDGPYAKAKSLEDFAGAKITGQLNTFHYEVIDQIPNVKKQTALADFPTMITSLSAGKIDGYVSESPGAMAAVVANPSLAYTVFDQGKGFKFTPDDISIAIGLAKDSPARERINEGLSEIPEEERGEAMGKYIELSTVDDGNETEVKKNGFFDDVKKIWSDYSSLFWRGMAITLLISIVGTAIGFLIGLLVQLIRTIPSGDTYPGGRNFIVNLLYAICTIYVEVFRGTPMMVQAMLIYYGSKMFFNIDMNAMFAAFLIVSINTGAYLAETIRGGMDSVSEGQLEAAKAIGLSHTQTIFDVVLPQAIRAILPSIGNELIVNVKDTSVLNVISVTELFFLTKGVAGSTLKTFQAYFIAAVIYLVLTLILSRLLKILSGRFNPDKPFELTSATN